MHALNNLPPLPEEVRSHCAFVFRGQFHPARIFWVPKTLMPKAQAWHWAKRSGLAPFGGQKLDGSYQNGWRKAHTANFWVYYAKEPGTLWLRFLRLLGVA